MYNKVLETSIDSLECEMDETLNTSQFENTYFSIRAYPNPIKEQLNLNFNASTNGVFTLQLYDVLGKEILKKSSNFNAGSNLNVFNLQHLNTQVILGRVVFKKDNGETSVKQLKLIIE